MNREVIEEGRAEVDQILLPKASQVPTHLDKEEPTQLDREIEETFVLPRDIRVSTLKWQLK